MNKNCMTLCAMAVSVVGTGAVAGGLSKSGEPTHEPRIVAADAPATPARFNWTGPYAGAAIGYGRMGFDTFADRSSATGGLFAGYRQDMGNLVLGGEVIISPTAFGNATLPAGGDEIKSGASLLLTAGVPLTQSARTLGYVAAGPSFVRTDGPGGSGTSTGVSIGLGVDHMLTEQWMLRATVTYTAVDNLGLADLDTRTVSAGLGLGFKF